MLRKLNNDLTLIIFKGIIKNKSLKDIHKELLEDTLSNKLKGVDTNVQYNIAIKKSKQIFNKVQQQKPAFGLTLMDLGTLTFNSINETHLSHFLDRQVSLSANKLETKNKKELINNTINQSRSYQVPQIFYLASSHGDCAIDHKNFQGKIYVDEKWESIIKEDELKKEIKKYINLHNVKTLQWVMDEPVWFITRPNCRHYIKPIPTEQVLSISVSDLLFNNKMEVAIGNRGVLQTISHDTKKEWYTKVNIQTTIDQYETRLKLHEDMYKLTKSEIVKNAIYKDKLLIKKWKDYLKKL